MSAHPSSRGGRSAVDFLEETVQLLRLTPTSTLMTYFLGSVPFVLGFLYFWTDMSRSTFAAERHPQGALLVALLFLWMKTWQAVFAALLHQQVTSGPGAAW